MLPEHKLSSIPIVQLYLYPDNIDPDPFKSWELGGIALNDPSQGLQVQAWYARLFKDGVTETDHVYIGAEFVPEQEIFVNVAMEEISLAFDSNMNPCFAYMNAGVAYFYWYDTVVSGYVTTTLPTGSRSPKCCLDDKRPLENATRDILLSYMRDDKLYYREQRDRYTVEYLLTSGQGLLDLIQIGMNIANRVQFALGVQEFPAGTVNYRGTVELQRRVTTDGQNRRLVKKTYG